MINHILGGIILARLIMDGFYKEELELLDEEWVELIAEALRIGLTPEEIRAFLQGTTNKIRDCS